jgi:hypothetical protein
VNATTATNATNVYVWWGTSTVHPGPFDEFFFSLYASRRYDLDLDL